MLVPRDPCNLKYYFFPLISCVCLEDKERWGAQQLLGHSFINPPPQKCPMSEESQDGEDLLSEMVLLFNLA